MNIIFENLEERLNFVDCPDVLRSGIRRFTTSPMINTMSKDFLNHSRVSLSDAKKLKHYVISTGVNHHPNDWTGSLNGNTVLSNLCPTYLEDLRNGKALLVIDQSLEGYQTAWLWDALHQDCFTHKVSLEALVYVTGNAKAPEQYKKFCDAFGYKKHMKVIAYEHFELDVQEIASERKTPLTWKKQLEYKKTSDIKTYNCLNKRLRPHRIWFYTELYKNNLLDEGLVSMNPYNVHPITIDQTSIDVKLLADANKDLPLLLYGKSNVEFQDNFYIRRILDQVYLDSWVSVVSEPAFAEADQSVFCSEKIFKSIASFHPFIIVGGAGSLKRLRELGYKTFDGFIDESYDTLPSDKRIKAIIESIKKIVTIEDKLSWYESMKDILVHNYNLLMNQRKPQAFVEMDNYYKEYFNVRHFFYKLWRTKRRG